MKLFTIYDVKSESYSAPTLNPARGQAIRQFADAVNSDDGVLSTHPEDFTLFELGDFDMKTGVITLLDAKEAVANGVDLKETAAVS